MSKCPNCGRTDFHQVPNECGNEEPATASRSVKTSALIDQYESFMEVYQSLLEEADENLTKLQAIRRDLEARGIMVQPPVGSLREAEPAPVVEVLSPPAAVARVTRSGVHPKRAAPRPDPGTRGPISVSSGTLQGTAVYGDSEAEALAKATAVAEEANAPEAVGRFLGTQRPASNEARRDPAVDAIRASALVDTDARAFRSDADQLNSLIAREMENAAAILQNVKIDQ